MTVKTLFDWSGLVPLHFLRLSLYFDIVSEFVEGCFTKFIFYFSEQSFKLSNHRPKFPYRTSKQSLTCQVWIWREVDTKTKHFMLEVRVPYSHTNTHAITNVGCLWVSWLLVSWSQHTVHSIVIELTFILRPKLCGFAVSCLFMQIDWRLSTYQRFNDAEGTLLVCRYRWLLNEVF